MGLILEARSSLVFSFQESVAYGKAVMRCCLIAEALSQGPDSSILP